MDVDSCHIDFISKLPQEITEIILSKLPIKYAVRTCILSRSCRYKWVSMTHIAFDDDESPKFINGFLSKHNGPIHKFHLSTYLAESCLEVDRWLLDVCQRDVRELTLQLFTDLPITVPPCVYSCRNLTRLSLHKCVLEPPPSFAGFSFLTYLELKYVRIPRKDMENLISSCPILESFTLADSQDSEFLTIRAPKLKCLNLESQFIDVCPENVPLLVDLTVVRRWIGDDEQSSFSYMEKLLGGVPKLERLCGKSKFIRFLSAAGFDRRQFITYEFLKQIELSPLNLGDPLEVSVALQLIFSSPNLQELYLRVIVSWHQGDPFPLLVDRTLNRLKLVTIEGEITRERIMKVIEILLDRSPSLVTMIIRMSNFLSEEMRELILSFRRASQKASIVFLDYFNRPR